MDPDRWRTRKSQSEIEKKLDYASKAEHSKNSIFFFFVFGVLLFLVSNKPLLSLKTPLFFFLGMLAISLLSIPMYVLRMAVARRITIEQAYRLRLWWTLGETAYDFGMTWLLFWIFQRIFH
jgi:Flp pilus assembly protein TadB